MTGIGGPVGRWLTQRIINQIRRRKGKMPILGFDMLVLTTIGARSGVQRATPVGRFPGKDGSWLIVASWAGSRKNPGWYHNIATHPDQVTIDTAGQKVAVIAEQLHGAERDEVWRQIVAAAPRYAKDAKKTDRPLPIIRLVPRDEIPER